jgi:hypothetical protein
LATVGKNIARLDAAKESNPALQPEEEPENLAASMRVLVNGQSLNEMAGLAKSVVLKHPKA